MVDISATNARKDVVSMPKNEPIYVTLLRCEKCEKIILVKKDDSEHHRCSSCRSNHLKKILVRIDDMAAGSIICMQESVKVARERIKVRAIVQMKEKVSEPVKSIPVPVAKKPEPVVKSVVESVVKSAAEPVVAKGNGVGVDDEFTDQIRDMLRGVWERTGSRSRVEDKARELFNRYKQKLESKYWVHDEMELLSKWFKPR